MKRLGVSIGIAILACSFAAACTSKKVAAAVSTQVLTPVAVTPAAVSTVISQPAKAVSTITVIGVGTTYAQPDSADAEFGLAVQRGTAAAALNKMKSEVATLTQVLYGAGVRSSDIAPDTSTLNNSANLPVVYTVGNNVHVEIDDPASVPGIVAKAAAALGTYLQNVNVTYGHDQSARLLSGARTTAMSDAKARALALAKMTGRSLGTIQSVSEAVTPGTQQGGYYGGPAPQSLSYTVSVTLVYVLR
jgi:uncharacterized protein YggE